MKAFDLSALHRDTSETPNSPWTMMCTDVVRGLLLVCTAQMYWPSSVKSTSSILMVNSSWFRVTKLTRGSTDHLSSPAYSILDLLSHAVCVTKSPCEQLQEKRENQREYSTFSISMCAMNKCSPMNYYRHIPLGPKHQDPSIKINSNINKMNKNSRLRAPEDCICFGSEQECIP